MAFKNRGFLFAVLLLAALVGNASAATYVVGDSLGWRVPNTPADYANWASQHTFAVGDVLVFNFATGVHDVAGVTKASYDGCSSSNPLSLATVGPSNITLSAAGETYYLCTFGSHCSLGQKLAINVSASSTSPAPAPAPSTPTTPTTPTPTPTPTPSRSPSPSPSPSSPTPTPTPTPVPMPSPGSAPAPAPSGSASPPPPGVPGLAPGSPNSPGDLSPPPPPSSATISTTSASLVGFAFVAVCLMI